MFNILTNFLNGLNNFVGNSGKCSQRQISPGSPVSDRFIHAGGVARGYVILTGSKKIKGGEKVTQGYVILTGSRKAKGVRESPEGT